MNRIFVTGDIHSEICTRFSNRNFPISRELDRSDIVIVAGDFGGVWDIQEGAQEKYGLDWLNNRNHLTLVVGGNHENWPRLLALPTIEKFGVKMGVIRENVLFIPNGTVFEYAGKTFWCFGGAMSTDKHQRVEGISWWPQEIPSYGEMLRGVEALDRVGNKVDIIITHTMPQESVRAFTESKGYHQDRVGDPVANYLSFIKKHNQFGMWFCGHFHTNQMYDGVHCLYEAIVDIGEYNSDVPINNYGKNHYNPLW